MNDSDRPNLHSGHRQRLRQEYLERGAEGMYEHQLLELLLTFAIPRKDTNDIAHRLLGKDSFGTLETLLKASPEELKNTPGIGDSAALLISLVGALSRKASAVNMEKERLNTPDAAIRYCHTLTCGIVNESIYVISLDKAHRVLHTDRISTGTPGEVTVYPRAVAECALRHGAQNVILCHNHPSGDVRPSREDCEATARIIQALAALGISLNDHIIIGGGDAYSMAREAYSLSGEREQAPVIAAEREE